MRRELFLDELPTADMKWSVRALLNFSYIPGINDAFEGSKEPGGQPTGPGSVSDETLGLEWLEEDGADENNNDTDTGGTSILGNQDAGET